VAEFRKGDLAKFPQLAALKNRIIEAFFEFQLRRSRVFCDPDYQEAASAALGEFHLPGPLALPEIGFMGGIQNFYPRPVVLWHDKVLPDTQKDCTVARANRAPRLPSRC
jgi:hypothetical protein